MNEKLGISLPNKDEKEMGKAKSEQNEIPSGGFFKAEVRIDIQPFDREISVEKLDQCISQMEG